MPAREHLCTAGERATVQLWLYSACTVRTATGTICSVADRARRADTARCCACAWRTVLPQLRSPQAASQCANKVLEGFGHGAAHADLLQARRRIGVMRQSAGALPLPLRPRPACSNPCCCAAVCASSRRCSLHQAGRPQQGGTCTCMHMSVCCSCNCSSEWQLLMMLSPNWA